MGRTGEFPIRLPQNDQGHYEVRRDIERRKDDVEADVKNKITKETIVQISRGIFRIQSKVDTSRFDGLFRSGAKFNKTFLMAKFNFFPGRCKEAF